MHISILTGVQKGHIGSWKTGHLLLENLLLMLKFHDEGHFYSNCWFYILTIYCKYLLFQFLVFSIRMQIPILTEVQKGHISQRKKSYFTRKCSLWSYFQDCEEDYCILIKECFVLCLFFEMKSLVYAKYLFYILTFYRKFFLFQFFSRGVRMHILILTGVQKGHNSNQKMYFWSLISNVKVTCMQIVLLVFLLFNVYPLFFSS